MGADTILKRFTKISTIGYLWVYVVAALLKGPTYAYDIKKRIKELFGFSPSTITLYAVVYNLRRHGLVKVVNEEPKTYAVTEEGVKALAKAVNYLERNISIIKELMRNAGLT